MSIVTLNDRGVRSVTAFGSLNTGSMVFIKKLTASDSSSLSFVNGSSDVVLDSTYKEYVFTFNNIHPSAGAYFTFQGNAAGGSGYNETITSTSFSFSSLKKSILLIPSTTVSPTSFAYFKAICSVVPRASASALISLLAL